MGHALIASFGGMPLLYMGDELGLLNDPSYLDDPALADDGRWMHRPRMDWAAAARRSVPGTVEARVFGDVQALVAARAATPHMHAAVAADVLDVDDRQLVAVVRRHPLGPLLAVYNLTERPARLDGAVAAGLGLGPCSDRLGEPALDAREGVGLAPYGAVWLVGA